MDTLADITLETPDAEPVRLGDLVDRPTLVQLTRYYG